MVEVGGPYDGFSMDFDDDEEEFRSCITEEDEWRESEESSDMGANVAEEEDDESTLKMFFKGVSISPTTDLSSRVSGIGVVMERSPKVPVLQVQKKLDFYVEEVVAELLALMDGLLEALKSNAHRVFAFTDSEVVYDQVTRGERLDNQLLTALSERILEHASKLEVFALKFVPSSQLEKPLQLAREAITHFGSFEDCPMCCEEKLPSQMVTLSCSHKFCSHCLMTYMDKKVVTAVAPIRCPQLRCTYYISASEYKSFLPVSSSEKMERFLAEANIYCPYTSCSVLLNPQQCLSTRASSSSQSETSCIECPDCQRFICANCGVPWHSSMTCEEYQSLPIEDRDAGNITLQRLAQNQRWKRCQECRRMIELAQGCYHITCWCGHEFCYSCGAEYRDGQCTCQCAFWDDLNFESLGSQTTQHQEIEPWTWDSFDSLPDITDGYSDQERSQLALIQRFLAGGFSLSDHHTCQSPPRCSDSYSDTIKDLHQLPWLERFVSVISDNYFEDYVHN
ncbi:E3 ubiquitin-protein ligase RSL1-like isoform X1 [Aristolochia californica]|uniref:E3 ubiquitin-protein ligase RSL1-like isoform X1 n=1 Tax=Aristolochia californica TaxID=171875 RepID=UPI0035D835B1